MSTFVFQDANDASEIDRKNNEYERQKSETTRKSDEATRIQNEKKRVSDEVERRNYHTNSAIPLVESLRDYDSQVTKNTNEINDAKFGFDNKEHSSLKHRLDSDYSEVKEQFNANSYIPFEGENVTVEHSLDGVTKDMVIEGRTYQNLFDVNTLIKTGSVSVANGIITQPMATNSNLIQYEKPNVNDNTKYTIVFNVIENTLTTPEAYRIIRPESYGVTVNLPKDFTIGVFKTTFTTNSSTASKWDEPYSNLYYTAPTPTEIIKFSFMLLEGDYTNKYTLPYFEGIKSVGESEDNKISILSRGKNLFNVKNLQNYGEGFKLIDATTNTFEINNNQNIEKDLLKIMNIDLSNKSSFTIKMQNEKKSGAGIGLFRVFYKNGTDEYVGNVDGGKYTRTISNAQEIKKIIFSYSNYGVTKFSDIFFCTTDSLEFEPYKEDKKEILLPCEGGHKGFPDGAKDTIEQREDGVWLVKKIGLFDCDKLKDNTAYSGSGSKKVVNFIINYNDLNISKKTTNVICTKLPYSDKSYDRGEIGIKSWIDSSATFVGTIPITEFVGIANVDGIDIKNWFSKNKVIIYYELATPVETKLIDYASCNLKTFVDTTHIISTNAINPNLKFKAPVDIPATISNLRNKNEDLKQENKELKEDVDIKTLALHEHDVELTTSSLDLDFRMFEVEMSLDIPMQLNNKIKGVMSMARSPFEMMKVLILNNSYDREDIEYKASRYLKGGRMTQLEHDEIISLMDASELN
ncbi:MAG: hypothetical protein RSC24_06580 [Clostridium sp.]